MIYILPKDGIKNKGELHMQSSELEREGRGWGSAAAAVVAVTN